MASGPRLDVIDLRRQMAALLDARLESDARTLYGTCGAIHVRAALGLPQVLMPRIRTWQQADGAFKDVQTSGDAHALCVAISAMNLTGESIPQRVAPLAPMSPAALVSWLDELDWSTTHKDFWGAITPVLASGLVSVEWTEALVSWLSNRKWWIENDPPWRVISCAYHILAALDAGCVPYPNAASLFDRLLSLQWDRANDDVSRTECTDGDWAWMLLRLSEMCPGHHDEVMTAVRHVSLRRVLQLQNSVRVFVERPTFYIHCVLWGTALFQHVCRDHFAGPFMRDTLNDPVLFRL